MKFSYELENYKLKIYELKDCEFESYKLKSYELKVYVSYYGRMNVREVFREDGYFSVNGEVLCDDCKGKRYFDVYIVVYL